MKKIIFFLFTFFSFIGVSFAGPSIEIQGGDREVSFGENVTLTGIVAGISCDNYQYDWSLYGGDIWHGVNNTNYTFEANNVDGYYVKFKLSCTNGEIFSVTTDYYSDNIRVNITGSPPPATPTISITGGNTTITPGNTISLGLEKSGFDVGCGFDIFLWAQTEGLTGSINDETGSGIIFTAPEENSTVKIALKVQVNSCAQNGLYNAETTITVKKSSGGGTSHSTRMRQEAENLFVNTGSIADINLILELQKSNNSPLMRFNWNNIGGDGQVEYFLEYSNNVDFEEYKNYKTTSREYNFIEYDLDKNNVIHFFRVKACYNEKCSDYSNILEYINNDDPLSKFQVKCYNCEKQVDYTDIFETYDILIEDNFEIKCLDCKKNNYNDIWESYPFLLDRLKIKSNIKPIKFDDLVN